QLRQSEGDLKRLHSLLGYAEQLSTPTTMAYALMLDTSGRFKSMILDRGSSAGIEVNDAVVNANGLIVRVVMTTKDMAKVQLLTDNNAAARAMPHRAPPHSVSR